jgi:hypothetical protein
LMQGEIMEYICQENNRDVSHLTGFQPPTLNDGGATSNRQDTVGSEIKPSSRSGAR